MTHPIICFALEKHALLLRAYYTAHHIDSIVHTTQAGFQVSVKQEQDIVKASALAKTFIAEPMDKSLQQAAWEHGDLATQPSAFFKGFAIENLALWRKQLFTCFVALACIVIWVLMNLGFAGTISGAIRMQSIPALLDNYEWWRVFGPNFMHAHLAHLLFNMVGWWFFSGVFERAFGLAASLGFFILTTLFTNVIYTYFWGPNFVGLSGTVFAVFGFLWCIGLLRPEWHVVMPKQIVFILLLSLALGFSGLLGENVSNAGHTLGLISGVLLALLSHKMARKSKALDTPSD